VPHFVDTNVLVYARDARDPRKQARALQVLESLWQSRLGRLSFQVLQEYYVTVTRKLSPGLTPEEAREDVRDLLAWNPVPVTAAVLEQAWDVEARFALTWWDGLIVASALTAGCATLLSEDFQDGLRIGGLQVRNPFAPDFDPARLES
jgi:predicted nucleic acid-binding protein